MTPARDHVLIGMERHDVGRPHDVGYPIRGIVTDDKLYLHNFEPDRWPACNPETGYLNCDAGATKTVILNARRNRGSDFHWNLCFGKRPMDELYDLSSDIDCIVNLAASASARKEVESLRDRLFELLRNQDDPRMSGNGKVFDEYLHSSQANRGFYERYMRYQNLGDEKAASQRPTAGWVAESDFEPTPLD